MKALFWLYLFNATLLIVHEIDSAYWKEWELFGMKGGIGSFVLTHIPLVFIILWGVVQMHLGTSAGLILSLIMGVAGIGGFSIHTYFIKKGRPEFNTPVSRLILAIILPVSLTQAVTAAYLLL